MSRIRERLRIVAEPGERADRVLARALTEAGRPCSRNEARGLIERGFVTVDGRRVDRSSTPLPAGPRALVVEADARALPALPFPHAATLEPGAVLHLDPELIVVDKPPGLPTDPTADPRRDSVLALVARHLEALGERSDGLRAVHRLDRDTSGVLLVARTRRAAARFGESFRDRDAAKVYLALSVHEALGPAWHERGGVAPAAAGPPRGWTPGQCRVVDAPIGRLEPGPGHVDIGVHPQGKEARTRLVLAATGAAASAFVARPETGRTHQIRVHLRHLGHPIAGDAHYGALGPAAPRVMLHAAQLTIAGQTWTAPAPRDFDEWAAAQGLPVPSAEG